MALTRPRFGQLNTSIVADADPITVLNQGATQANTDVGFLFNRANGLVSNVALYWSESANSIITAFTNNNGGTDANIAVSSYANLTVGSILLVNGTIYAGNVPGQTGQFLQSTGSGMKWADGSFDGGYVAGTTTFGSSLIANSATISTSTTTGALTVDGGVGVTGNVYATKFYGNIAGGSVTTDVFVSTNIVPTANSQYSLGSPNLRFKDLYISGNTIDMDTAKISIVGGEFSFGTSTGNTANGTFGNVYADAVFDSNTRVVSTSSGAGNLTINGTEIKLTPVGPGAVTTGSASAIPVITTDAYGRISAITTAAVSSTLNIVGSTGTGNVSLTSQSLSIVGGTGVTTSASGQSVTISIPQEVNTTSAPTFAGLTVTNTVTASTINAATIGNIGANVVGVGTYLTDLNASNLSSGTVSSARISGSYSGITAVGTLTDLTVTNTINSDGNINIAGSAGNAIVANANVYITNSKFFIAGPGSESPNFVMQGDGEQTFRFYNSNATPNSSTRVSWKLANRNNPDWTWIMYNDVAANGADDFRLQNRQGVVIHAGNIGDVTLGRAATTGNVKIAWTAPSISSTSGALQVSGGAGIAGNLYVGGNFNVVGNLTVSGTTNTINNTIYETTEYVVNQYATTVNAATIGNIGANIVGTGTYLTNLSSSNLTGTIPSAVLGNSTLYIGTTGVALNRASSGQTLTGVSIDGSAATLTTARTLTIGSTGKTFNGSADVSWSLSEIGAIPSGTPALTADINTIASKSDVVRWNNTTNGRPADTQTNEYGPMLQMSYDGTDVSQFAYDLYQNNLYLRQLNTSTDVASAWRKVWTDGNDGTGSGLDADLLDGLNSATTNTASTIVARDASGNFSAGTVSANLTGYKNVDNTNEITIANGFAGGGPLYLNYRGSTTATTMLRVCDGMAAGAQIPVEAKTFSSTVATGTAPLNVVSSTTVTNLSADMLDGIHASSFLRSDISQQGGKAYVAHDFNTYPNLYDVTFVNPGVSSNLPTGMSSVMSYRFVMGAGDTAARGFDLVGAAEGSGNLYIRERSLGTWNKLWHNNNDGTGSGLDADLLDGQHGTYYINTSSTAQTKSGDLTLTGKLSAASKSFLIPHPTKENKKLEYGSLEGPENGVYVRGKLTGSNVIELPDYWTKLVDPESITVNLTPIGKHQNLFVEDISNNKVTVGNSNLFSKEINCFYTVYAERRDVDKLKVEID